MAYSGNHVAVILCARYHGGKILLVNTHGIEVRKASQAANEAFAILGQQAVSDDVGDIATTIQGLPLSCGSVRLWHGRWRVFYRSLGPTLAMVLAPGNQNAFTSLNLLGQVVRVVSSDGRIPEVAIERVQRKYSEIYFALDAMVGSCGVLSASEALGEAHSMMESLGASPGQALTKRLARHPIPPVSYKVEKRTLASQLDQVGALSLGAAGAMAGMRALPGFELEDRQQPLEEKVPEVDDDKFAGSQKKDDTAKEGDPFEEMFGPIKDADIKPAELAKPAHSGTPTRPLLRLMETWRAEFVGAKLLRCALDGDVTWADDAADDPLCPVSFALSSAVWADQQVKDCLRSAQRHSMATSISHDGSGSIVADGASSRMTPPPVLLKYHLPPGPGMVPPLLVNVSTSTQSSRDGSTAVLIGLRIAVAQQSHLSFQTLNISLSVPPLLKQLVRASPPGALFSPERHVVRWSLSGESLSPGGLEVLAALFRVRADEAACAAAAQDVVAEAELLGPPGGGCSGVSLSQAFEQSTTRVEKTIGWQAHVVARPSPVI